MIKNWMVGSLGTRLHACILIEAEMDPPCSQTMHIYITEGQGVRLSCARVQHWMNQTHMHILTHPPERASLCVTKLSAHSICLSQLKPHPAEWCPAAMDIQLYHSNGGKASSHQTYLTRVWSGDIGCIGSQSTESSI